MLLRITKIHIINFIAKKIRYKVIYQFKKKLHPNVS